MRDLPRLLAAGGRLLCPDCLAEHHAANPATALDVAAAIGRSEAEPTTAQLRHADYRCDACDATGAQALEPGGPLHGTAVR
jgi:hypothetical protein